MKVSLESLGRPVFAAAFVASALMAVQAAAAATAATPDVRSGSSYTTRFKSTEDPLSEGGLWIDGQATGIDWHDARGTGVSAVGTQAMPAASRYSDNIAVIDARKKKFSADQYATGVVAIASGYTGNGGQHEAELLLRFSISPHDAHGYEVLWGVTGYLAVVRWNGPVGDYTPLYDPGVGSMPVPRAGDVLRGEIKGDTISVYLNGQLRATVVDSSYQSGQPGVGFWPVDGAVPQAYGWRSFTAGAM